MKRNGNRWGVGLGLLVLLVSVVSVSADPWSDARQRQREERQALRDRLDNERERRAAQAEQQLSAFVGRSEAEGWRVEPMALWGMLAGLVRLDPDRVGELPRRIRALPATTDPDAMNPAYVAALAQTRAALTAEAYDLLKRAADVGEVQVAVELMWEVLCFDPDYEPIRDALGQVRLADEVARRLPRPQRGVRRQISVPELADFDPDANWFSPFDARMLNRGLMWNQTRGWMPIEHADRYDRGAVYDAERRKWTTIDEANDYHSRAGRDWRIRTEHLDVRGTASLDQIALVASELEAMYDEIFAVYAAFFAQSRRHDPLRLALGLTEHQPLVVWVYRDHAEYVRRSGGPDWSGGLFRPDTKASYFYGGPSVTMYHEFTHQVLHVMTGKNNAPSWLTEAIAVYTQTATFIDNGLAFRGAPYAGRLPLDDLFALRNGKAWNRHAESGRPSAYAEGGSLATFCMEAENQRFRADFIDYVRDAYQGKTRGREVWEYLGLSRRELEVAYHRWGTQGG